MDNVTRSWVDIVKKLTQDLEEVAECPSCFKNSVKIRAVYEAGEKKEIEICCASCGNGVSVLGEFSGISPDEIWLSK